MSTIKSVHWYQSWFWSWSWSWSRSGPRYMIYVTHFARWASQKTTGHARIARYLCLFSCGREFFGLWNVWENLIPWATAAIHIIGDLNVSIRCDSNILTILGRWMSIVRLHDKVWVHSTHSKSQNPTCQSLYHKIMPIFPRSPSPPGTIELIVTKNRLAGSTGANASGDRHSRHW